MQNAWLQYTVVGYGKTSNREKEVPQQVLFAVEVENSRVSILSSDDSIKVSLRSKFLRVSRAN